MNIWKKQSDNLRYYFRLNAAIVELLLKTDEKKNFKNYWLQKKEDKEHDNKLEKIAEFVTKYIKTQTKR